MAPPWTFTPGSPGSVAAFLFVCALVVAAFLTAVWKSARREGKAPGPRVLAVALGTAAWLGALALLVRSGWAEAMPAPRLLVLMGGILLVSLAAGLSPLGRWLAAGPTLGGLVAFQGFRLPLELVLHAWAHAGVIPRSMTWDGSNGDVASGILALVLAPFASQSRAAAWAANAVGIVLLANVILDAARSSPGRLWSGVLPPLQLPFHLPYALILPVCIGGALVGHVALTRALLAKRS
jgi:hypothetical protein